MTRYSARKRAVTPVRDASAYLLDDSEAERTQTVVGAVYAALEAGGLAYTRGRAVGAKGYKFTVDTLGLLLGAVARLLARAGYTFRWDQAFERSSLALTLHEMVVQIDRRTTAS